MKIDAIEIWDDEDTKEVFEAKSSFLLKDVARVLDYTQRGLSLWKRKEKMILIVLKDGDRIAIFYDYDEFNKLWTDFLDNSKQYQFN